MGQLTYGLCYGVPTQKIKGYEGDETDEAFVVDMKDAINALQNKAGISYWEAESRIKPDYMCEVTEGFLGFFVAAGASGKDGIPMLEAFDLRDVNSIGSNPFSKKYGNALNSAKDAWAVWDSWCKKRNIKMPTPSLWIVEMEVA